MVTNVMLMKLTGQGAKDIKKAPERIQEAIKTFEAMGGKLVAFYAVLGEWDYVAIGEAPDESVGLAFILGLSAQGNVSTTTLRAFSVDQFTACCAMLPG
jgi:uncharacterized protein with GYD domain